MKYCCIIGGFGFIGTSLVNCLILKDRKLSIIGRKEIPPSAIPKGVRYIQGDISNKAFLREALKNVDEVVNLAYSTVPKTSFDDPVQDIAGNLPAAVTLFEVASELPIRKLVLVSSGGTIYGKPNQLPIREDHPTNPISPYGITKLSIEKYALMFHEIKGLPVVCVRPSNAFGEGQKPFLGQGFVATAIATILRNENVILYGEKGTIRDYIHVSDVANGILSVLEKGKPGTTYNIGSGIGKSNRDVLDAIRPFAGQADFQIQTEVLSSRPFDVPINILDSEKLIHDTHWRLRVPFEEGIGRAWNWYYRNAII